MKTRLIHHLMAALLGVVFAAELVAQPTTITYQGQLTENGSPSTGLYDFVFTLYDSSGGPTVVAGPLTNNATVVAKGLFTVTLDFGLGVFDGNDRWLEIATRTNGSGAFSALLPRQQITSAPYAIKAVNAMTVEMGTISNPAFIGTTTMTPLEFHVHGLRAFRLEDNGDGITDGDTIADGAPNVIGGSEANTAGPGVVGVTIAGGGATNYSGINPTNAVFSDYGTIGGGLGNRIEQNSFQSTISGGYVNTIASNSARATISGGFGNDIGVNSDYGAIGGGRNNDIATDAFYSSIPGGYLNAIGDGAAYAFAAGRRAKANHSGVFVWADSQDADVASTTTNQVVIRAQNGVRLTEAGGPDATITIGDQYRDNAILAWGKVTSAGNLAAGFGVASVTNHSDGNYEIFLTDAAVEANSLIPVAIAEIDGGPSSASAVRIVSIDQNFSNFDRFRVYINNGNYTPVNNDFVFMVTAR